MIFGYFPNEPFLVQTTPGSQLRCPALSNTAEMKKQRQGRRRDTGDSHITDILLALIFTLFHYDKCQRVPLESMMATATMLVFSNSNAGKLQATTQTTHLENGILSSRLTAESCYSVLTNTYVRN